MHAPGVCQSGADVELGVPIPRAQDPGNVQSGGKKIKDIRHAMHLQEDGSARQEHFTGSMKAEARMLLSFTPTQRRTYFRAQRENIGLAQCFKRVVARGSRPVPAGS